jgi:hypothetical protein
VVTWALILARGFVDHAGTDLFHQRRGHQDVVNAQSAVALERKFAVVPPRVTFGGLLEQPESIVQPQVEQGFEVGTFLVGAMDGAGQGNGVPHIQVVPGDVEVTHEHQFVVAAELVLDEGLQSVKPRHFVDKLVAVWRLAIGEIRTHDTHTLHRGGDDTGHLVGETLGCCAPPR